MLEPYDGKLSRTVLRGLRRSNPPRLPDILAYDIPLEKLIRYSLSARGYDKDHKWVGFNKAKDIWLE
ncbi:hypothetical protein ACFO3O_12000 [Dokdonia ponticola]|uniref:Uncharacterized protein n=1 Tax=Dokdonia ponticola TaxID=2041041 RepID=A0ABV9HWV0_9FLAO